MPANQHPSTSELIDHSFETGQARRRGRDAVFPRFSRGQDHGDPFQMKDVFPRSSRGQERDSKAPESLVEGKFSAGQERLRGRLESSRGTARGGS